MGLRYEASTFLRQYWAHDSFIFWLWKKGARHFPQKNLHPGPPPYSVRFRHKKEPNILLSKKGRSISLVREEIFEDSPRKQMTIVLYLFLQFYKVCSFW